MMTDAVRSSLPMPCLGCPIMAMATDTVVPRVVREAIATRDMVEHAHLLATYNAWRVRARPSKLDVALANLREFDLMVSERPLDLRPKRFARAWDVAWKTPRRTVADASCLSRTPVAPTDRTRVQW